MSQTEILSQPLAALEQRDEFSARHLGPSPADVTEMLAREDADTDELLGAAGTGKPGRGKGLDPSSMAIGDLRQLIQDLTDQMHQAASELQFEVAARHRDEISDLKKELRQMIEANK